jgi:hypothetical protein
MKSSDVVGFLIFIFLILVLLFVLTKTRIIYPSSIPFWQNIYCNVFVQHHGQIAIIYGSDGIGNVNNLTIMIQQVNPNLVVEPIDVSSLSPGLLSNFDLVILDHVKTVSFTAVLDVEDYLNSGGQLLWIGDSFTNQTLTSADLADALLKNQTQPFYYENLTKQAAKQVGFGTFGSKYLFASYLNHTNLYNIIFKIDASNNYLINGLKSGENVSIELALINLYSSPTQTRVADAVIGNQTYPAVLIEKSVGSIIVYTAFPPEEYNSTVFVNNIINYLVPC